MTKMNKLCEKCENIVPAIWKKYRYKCDGEIYEILRIEEDEVFWKNGSKSSFKSVRIWFEVIDN
jgi:hypothetical protein